MLIKAKERKTLVPACGGCCKPRSGRRRLSRSRSPTRETKSTSIVERRCTQRTAEPGVERVPRIFIPRELRRLYSLPVVRRYEAWIAVTTCGCRATLPYAGRWGIKNEGRSGTAAGAIASWKPVCCPASARSACFRFRVRSRSRASPRNSVDHLLVARHERKELQPLRFLSFR